MTTFTDRENAMEAHYALLELAAFKERLHLYKKIGLRVAARLNMADSAAQEFSANFAERLGTQIGNDALWVRVSAELARQGIPLADAEVRRLVLVDEREAEGSEAMTPAQRSWMEFVVVQLIILFGADRTRAQVEIAARSSATRAAPQT